MIYLALATLPNSLFEAAQIEIYKKDVSTFTYHILGLKSVGFEYNSLTSLLAEKGFTRVARSGLTGSEIWVKAAKPRETRQAKARRALDQYLKEKEDEYPF